MKTAHILIIGFVQGVGFRQFVKRNARKLHIQGWARNLPDGSVEIISQGEEDKLLTLITLCQKGPFLSDVKNVIVTWDDFGEKFNDFQIRVS